MTDFAPENILCPVDFSDLEPLVRRGNAADRIIASAREQQDDLIVLGARHRAFHEATFLGRTTDLVVRHASVPVLVVPQFAQ